MSTTPIDRERAGDCPAEERWAALAAGLVAKSEAEKLMAHAAACPECAGVLKETLAIVADDTGDDEVEREFIAKLETSKPEWAHATAAKLSRSSGMPVRKWLPIAAAVLLAVGGSGFWWSQRSASSPAVLLAKAYTEARPFEYRLPDAGYGPVKQERGAASAFDRPPSLISAEAELLKKLGSQPDDAGLVDLKGRSQLLERDYEGAIESVTRALALRRDDAGFMADLGVAYAVRAGVEKRNIDYGHAIDLFLKVLKTEPANAQVLFNLALAYEGGSQLDNAADAWEKLLHLSLSADWREESVRHRDAVEEIRREKKKSDNGILREPAQFLAKSGANPDFDPESYIDVFWADWLPNADTDPRKREAARRVGESFRRRYGDDSLAHAADSGASGEGMRKLAAAIALNRSGQTDSAIAAAGDSVRALDEAGQTAAALRARLELAYAHQRSAHGRECFDVAARVSLVSASKSWIWLDGQAHLLHAACADALSASDVRSEIEGALTEFERAGMGLAKMRALGFITGFDIVNGDQASVWTSAPEGLAAWWRSDGSMYTAQEFEFDLFKSAAALGWNDCAAVMARDALRMLQTIGNPAMEAADRVELAALFATMNDPVSQAGELVQARNLIRSMDAGPARDDLAWNVELEGAEADIAAGRPGDVPERLKRIAADASTRRIAEQFRMEQARGQALFAMHRWRDAAEALGNAVNLNQRFVASASSWRDRLAELEVAAPSYRELTQIDLIEDRNPTAALRTWRLYREDARVASSGAPVITYAALPAGIAVWLSDGTSVRSRMVEAPAGEVEETSRRFLALCSSPASGERDIHTVGNELYRWLIRPEMERLRGERIDIQTDSWLASVPFGALTDDTGKYLVESHAFAETAGASGKREGDAPITRDTPAFVVAVRSAKTPDGRALPRLIDADAEGADVAGRFGRKVEKPELAGLFHFAGHGWSDGGNGALILEPSPEGKPRFITASEIARQDWGRCSLAVLSACLTATGEERGAVNNQSLVRALLSAGARRVIAARWSIDSRSTRELMRSMYGGLLEGANAPEALRRGAAEVSHESGWSHPWYWAGFQIYQRM